jgi:hypothetical protein
VIGGYAGYQYGKHVGAEGWEMVGYIAAGAFIGGVVGGTLGWGVQSGAFNLGIWGEYVTQAGEAVRVGLTIEKTTAGIATGLKIATGSALGAGMGYYLWYHVWGEGRDSTEPTSPPSRDISNLYAMVTEDEREEVSDVSPMLYRDKLTLWYRREATEMAGIDIKWKYLKLKCRVVWYEYKVDPKGKYPGGYYYPTKGLRYRLNIFGRDVIKLKEVPFGLPSERVYLPQYYYEH